MNTDSVKPIPLEFLSDNVTEAHAKIQNDFKNLNPVVGVSRKLRSLGITADTMTIDCLKSGKRIIIILHDSMPNIVRFQFSYIKQDPSNEFEELALCDVTVNQLYTWMKYYFL